MTEEQMATKVAGEGILEDDVLQALLRNFRTWPRAAKWLHFSSVPRSLQRFQEKVLTVQRFCSYDDQLPNHYTNRSLAFTVNQRIFVAGVGIYGPRKACTFYFRVSIEITKVDCPRPTVIEHAEKTTLLKCDGTTPIISLKFDDPFEVEPNTSYEILAKITPTKRSVSIIKAKFNSLLYSSAHEVSYYYGIGANNVADVIAPNGQTITFSFFWNSRLDDSISIEESRQATSAPSTPQVSSLGCFKC